MKVNHREKKRTKFRFSFILLFIIASFVVCFTLYMKDDIDIESKLSFIDEIKIKKTDDVTEDVFAEIDDTASNSNIVKIINPIRKSTKTDNVYLNKTMFIGTSELQGFSDYNFVPKKNVISNSQLSILTVNEYTYTFNNSETNIFAAADDIQPNALYLLFGKNDVTMYDDSSYFDAYSAFIQNIKNICPNTNIYIISLLPITTENETDIITNSLIDSCNSKLLEFANTQNICYIDVNTELKGNDGKMPSSMVEKNTDRLKRDTYSEFTDYILTHIYTKN